MSKHFQIGMTLRDSEKAIIIDALEFYHYNKTMTAQSLGISIRGLDGKMKDLEIENKRKNFTTDADETELDRQDGKGDNKSSKK